MPKEKGRKPRRNTHEAQKTERLILSFMSKKTSKIYDYKLIADGIDYKNPHLREGVLKALQNLVGQNRIKQIKPGKYTLNVKLNETLTGTIDFNQSGNAYVKVEGYEKDIFIHQKNVKNALQGDTVMIVPFHFNGRKLEGAVVDVLERHKTSFVGTFQYVATKDVGFVVIGKKIINTDIFVPKSKFNGAKDGDKVVVKMLQWRLEDKNPEGEIVEVLGIPGEHETEIHSILAEFELPSDFPAEIEAEADALSKDLPDSEIAKRRDIRSVLTFTIDPKDAKDFDDALSFQKLENGNIEVGVHIADVSYYIRPDTELDKEAYQRGTSIYLVDRVIPMLPEVLSNKLCSLRPDEDKFTFSAIFELDDKAQVQKQWFGRTVIRSNRRYAYSEAQERIETKTGDYAEEINELNDLAVILRRRRLKDGAIAFDREEVKFNLDENKNPIGVYFKISKEANHLIEEFMLLANRKVSEFVSLTNKGVPTNNTFIYRIHDDPDPIKLGELREFVEAFGYKLDISNRNNLSISLNDLLQQVKGKPEQNMIETLAMRSMSKAVYSTDNIGHFGLSFKYYSHFTSPIRRYPDIIAHRLLQHYLDKGKSPQKEPYEIKAQYLSERERVAADAERESIKFMQVKFMEKHVGEVFDGVISGVTDWGVYVEIPENGAEGLIRLRDLTDDSYVFDSKTYSVVGSRSGKTYRLGDNAKIMVVRANVVARQLDFKMVD